VADMYCNEVYGGCNVVMNPTAGPSCGPLYYNVPCGQWLLITPNPFKEGITACLSTGVPGPNVECEPVDPIYPTSRSQEAATVGGRHRHLRVIGRGREDVN
jgi:hypothetical protein